MINPIERITFALRIVTVCSSITAIVCIFMAYMLFAQMRYEKEMHRQAVIQLVDSCTVLAEHIQAEDEKLLLRYHKSNWHLKK